MIALVITGHLRPSVSEDYDVLLSDGLNLSKSDYLIIDLDAGDNLPTDIVLDGILISGSAKMLGDKIGWLERTCEWLRLQEKKNIPMLGICFGHQIIAHSLGGKVTDNPNGIEVGTKKIYFNEQARSDVFLQDYFPEITVQLSHVQSVVELPEKAEVLAYSDLEPYQAFRLKDNIWGLQFHPEFNAEIIKKLIISKAKKYPGKIDAEKLLTEVEETPESYSILEKFGEIITN